MDLTIRVIQAPRHKYLVLGSKFCLFLYIYIFFFDYCFFVFVAVIGIVSIFLLYLLNVSLHNYWHFSVMVIDGLFGVIY